MTARSPQEVAERYAARTADKFERWLGDLYSMQEALIAAWSGEFTPPGAARLESRHWRGRLQTSLTRHGRRTQALAEPLAMGASGLRPKRLL
jgi:hypothetical protein